MRDSAREIEMETARTAPRAEKKEKLINLELLFRGILNKNTASGNKQKRSEQFSFTPESQFLRKPLILQGIKKSALPLPQIFQPVQQQPYP